jgi:hypothetical protein
MQRRFASARGARAIRDVTTTRETIMVDHIQDTISHIAQVLLHLLQLHVVGSE